MGLADYQPERRAINVGDFTFHVEALSLTTVAILIREHVSDLEAIFELFKAKREGIENQDFKKIALALISEAPGLAANIIAVASGETDATESAAKLPFPTQLEALLTIGDMTFTEVGGVKKSLEMIATLLRKNQMDVTGLTKTPIVKKKVR